MKKKKDVSLILFLFLGTLLPFQVEGRIGERLVKEVSVEILGIEQQIKIAAGIVQVFINEASLEHFDVNGIKQGNLKTKLESLDDLLAKEGVLCIEPFGGAIS